MQQEDETKPAMTNEKPVEPAAISKTAEKTPEPANPKTAENSADTAAKTGDKPTETNAKKGEKLVEPAATNAKVAEKSAEAAAASEAVGKAEKPPVADVKAGKSAEGTTAKSAEATVKPATAKGAEKTATAKGAENAAKGMEKAAAGEGAEKAAAADKNAGADTKVDDLEDDLPPAKPIIPKAAITLPPKKAMSPLPPKKNVENIEKNTVQVRYRYFLWRFLYRFSSFWVLYVVKGMYIFL